MEIMAWVLDKVIWAISAISIGQWFGIGLLIASNLLHDYHTYRHFTRRRTSGGVIELPVSGYKGLWAFRFETVFAALIMIPIGLVGVYLIMNPIFRGLEIWPYH